MSGFLGNSIKLLSAAILGQMLGILVTPILSRLYTPADFGVFQLFFSLVSVIAAVSCLSYHSAIQLPEKDEDAAGIYLLCSILIIITSLITGIIFTFGAAFIEQALNAPGLSAFFILMPVAIVCNSMAFVATYWLARKNEFGTIARANLSSSITGKGTSVGLGIFSPSPVGLIAGTIINDATIAILLIKKALQDTAPFRRITWENIRAMAVRYKKFPLFNTWSTLFNTLSSQATPFLLAIFFSMTVVGFYAIAYMLIRLPLKLAENSINQVFYRNACVERNRTGSIRKIVSDVHHFLISIGIFPFILLIIIGPELFSLALGPQWKEAGLYAGILSPWIFIVFISTPLLTVFNVLERQGASLAFNTLLLVSRIVVLIIGGFLGDPILALLLFSLTGVFFWYWMNTTILEIAGIPARTVGSDILRHLVLAIIICSPLIAGKYFGAGEALLIGAAGILTVLYYGTLIFLDTALRTGIESFIAPHMPSLGFSGKK